MRPGCEREYPSSPLPTTVLQGPRHSLYWHDMLQYCLCCLPSWQLVIQIYLPFWNVKRNLSFGLAVVMSRALLPPPSTHKILLQRAACARSKLGGPWHGRSYFFSLGWQVFQGPDLIWPGLSDFRYFFYNQSKMHHCKGKILKQNR